MKNLFALSLLLTGFLFMTSCDSGEDPIITITSPEDGADYSAGDVLGITGTATDDSGITRINIASGSPTLLLDNDLNLATATDVTSIPINITLELDSMLTQGAYILNLTATDDDNNVVLETLNFNIR